MRRAVSFVLCLVVLPHASALCCIMSCVLWLSAVSLCVPSSGAVLCIVALCSVYCDVLPRLVLLWAVVYYLVSFGAVWCCCVSHGALWRCASLRAAVCWGLCCVAACCFLMLFVVLSLWAWCRVALACAVRVLSCCFVAVCVSVWCTVSFGAVLSGVPSGCSVRCTTAVRCAICVVLCCFAPRCFAQLRAVLCPRALCAAVRHRAICCGALLVVLCCVCCVLCAVPLLFGLCCVLMLCVVLCVFCGVVLCQKTTLLGLGLVFMSWTWLLKVMCVQLVSKFGLELELAARRQGKHGNGRPQAGGEGTWKIKKAEKSERGDKAT